MRGDLYQYSMIVLGTASTLLFGFFFYRELFPEYKIYQKDYMALEEFRSTYTGDPPAAFDVGVKQIIIEREDKGPPVVDRCISCHVALKLEHFSPTVVEHDVNGNVVYDDKGWPRKVENPKYIWKHLEHTIDALLQKKDASSLALAERYQSLKTATVDGKVYDVSKVLRMHPLMGREVRPFQYHSIEEYGCTSCHNGNGNGLTTEKAHGPFFDGMYEEAEVGYEPDFTEIDPENDPKFSKIFNHKPGDYLLFQTTPIFIGGLIEAKCVQCHQPTSKALLSLSNQHSRLNERKQKELSALLESVTNEEKAFITLTDLQVAIQKDGLQSSLNALKKRAQDPVLSDQEVSVYNAQIHFLEGFQELAAAKDVEAAITQKLVAMAGSTERVVQAQAAFRDQSNDSDRLKALDTYVQAQIIAGASGGSLIEKALTANGQRELLGHVQESHHGMALGIESEQALSRLFSDIDLLTPTYQKGEELFFSQACYACHKIAGLSRGGVGPELTEEGNSYPWFVKESIVWPQADLKTSTMPNFRLDHDELEALMTFLMAQKGQSKATAEVERLTSLREWDAGRKNAIEQPVDASKIQDLRYSMKVFATEGCAACHRLKGFESNVGFRSEKDPKLLFKNLYAEQQWFKRLIPETIIGTELVKVLEDHAAEIDQRLISDARQDSILEEIEKEKPGEIEALYTPFKFAARAKNSFYERKRQQAATLEEKAAIDAEERLWKERVHRTLMIYIQEYGLGRLVGPRPNWSGIYRSDEWLMEHFKNPTALIARSIMPVFPFDTTKFYALTDMLDVLGQKNREAVHAIWQLNGFSPALAYEIHCAQCHGNYLQGNGPVAEWIYPIPKNLRNAEFLRNLTKQRVMESIYHGIKGTPMPPWGEVASDKPIPDQKPVLTSDQIEQLADWLFSSLPGSTVIRESGDVPKWQYSPQDVLRELKEEGDELKDKNKPDSPLSQLKDIFPKGEGLLASISGQLFFPSPRKPSPALMTEEQVFDRVPQEGSLTSDKNYYYIKQRYYTPENLEQGRLFFEENCAACHGRDADGAGLRAGAMQDAKPRMLINFSWIETRDDMRLLRSIKYGVPGTSMQPWGDYTTSLQRLQLVMYVRSLSQEQKLRSMLGETLFQHYNRADLLVERARIESSQAIQELEDQRHLAREQRSQYLNFDQKKALDLYQKELNIDQEIQALQAKDQLFLQLRDNLTTERVLFQQLGASLINQKPSDALQQDYLDLIGAMSLSYELVDGKLVIKAREQSPELTQTALKKLTNEMDGEIAKLGENSSVAAEVQSKRAIKRRLIADVAQAERLHRQQMELVQKIYKEKD